VNVTALVDLSVPLGPGTVVYPGDPVPDLRVHSTIAEHGFNLLEVRIGSQTGTHVDAPYHMDGDGPRIDAVPLGRFLGPAVVVDATGRPPGGLIRGPQAQRGAHRRAPGVVVLLHTGWSRHYGTPAYFEHPYLHPDACRRILQRGVRTICIDAINLDETPDEQHPGTGFPVHHLIAEVGGVIGENFRNLAAIDWPDPFVLCLPIALSGADGAPVRAVAVRFDRT
jgi:kynurenine formamidase